MKNQTASSLHFQRKISEFCDVRVAPLVSKRILDNIKPYLTSLILYRKHPPMRNERIDWHSISYACGLDGDMTAALKKNLQPTLEAIIRWIDREPSKDDDRFQASDRSTKPTSVPAGSVARQRKSPSAARAPSSPATKAKTGVAPKPIEKFPEPLFDWTDDPPDFQQALIYHMRRYGDSYWHLHRAVTGENDAFDHKTLFSWIKGTKVPRSLDSFEILSRIEHRYRLPCGYLKGKLPHPSRSASGHQLGSEISSSERRRLAWHLPDDFNSLPFSKREEILEWVRRMVISGSTDYRRFQAAATRQRYAIRFPGISYGGTLSARSTSESLVWDDKGNHKPVDDPDLLAGVVDAPPRLAMEMANLIRFKTATLTTLGFQRNGVWGEETASQKLEHLGLMFGALAASPKGIVKGYGVPLSQLSFGLLVFPGIWDWYLQWREKRRGFYTKWEEDMLSVLLGMVRPDTGWIWQHPELIQNVKPIPGLIGAEEIAAAQKDWQAACDACFKHASQRSKEIQRVARVHRDPFEPIMCILEADSRKQEAVANQITERLLAGQPKIDAFDRLLDDLQKQRDAMEAELSRLSTKKDAVFKPFTINPSMFNQITRALTTIVRTGKSEHDAVQGHFNLMRELVQKVVIAPSPDGKSADLTIHGRLASILASMKAFQDYSKAMRADFTDDYARRVRAGELKGQKEKLDFVSRFRAVLAEEEADWKRLQVSVVAGAGFEPAAFRL